MIVPVSATTLSVKSSRTSGITLYVGGSGPGNYTTIQAAVNASQNGDTVFVYDDSAPYFESVVIAKSITLAGENEDTTIINGTGHNTTISVMADGVTIHDFTIERAHEDGIGLASNASAISKVTVIDCGYNGISTIWHRHQINGTAISQCHFMRDQLGLYLGNSDGALVQQCNFSHCGWGTHD